VVVVEGCTKPPLFSVVPKKPLALQAAFLFLVLAPGVLSWSVTPLHRSFQLGKLHLAHDWTLGCIALPAGVNVPGYSNYREFVQLSTSNFKTVVNEEVRK
jgi:hypothetical protein